MDHTPRIGRSTVIISKVTVAGRIGANVAEAVEQPTVLKSD